MTFPHGGAGPRPRGRRGACGDGGGGGQRLQRLLEALRPVAVGGVTEHRPGRRTDALCRPLRGPEHPAPPEGGHPLRVRRLVRPERDDDQRQAVGQRGHHPARAAVRHHQIAAREDQALRHVALDVHVGGRSSGASRAEGATDGQQERPGGVAESLAQGGEEPQRGPVEDGAEGGADVRRRQVTVRPGGQRVGERPVEHGGAQAVAGRGRGGSWKAGGREESCTSA
jgi:hypothetical protein